MAFLNLLRPGISVWVSITQVCLEQCEWAENLQHLYTLPHSREESLQALQQYCVTMKWKILCKMWVLRRDMQEGRDTQWEPKGTQCKSPRSCGLWWCSLCSCPLSLGLCWLLSGGIPECLTAWWRSGTEPPWQEGGDFLWSPASFPTDGYASALETQSGTQDKTLSSSVSQSSGAGLATVDIL